MEKTCVTFNFNRARSARRYLFTLAALFQTRTGRLQTKNFYLRGSLERSKCFSVQNFFRKFRSKRRDLQGGRDTRLVAVFFYRAQIFGLEDSAKSFRARNGNDFRADSIHGRRSNNFAELQRDGRYNSLRGGTLSFAVRNFLAAVKKSFGEAFAEPRIFRPAPARNLHCDFAADNRFGARNPPCRRYFGSHVAGAIFENFFAADFLFLLSIHSERHEKFLRHATA